MSAICLGRCVAHYKYPLLYYSFFLLIFCLPVDSYSVHVADQCVTSVTFLPVWGHEISNWTCVNIYCVCLDPYYYRLLLSVHAWDTCMCILIKLLNNLLYIFFYLRGLMATRTCVSRCRGQVPGMLQRWWRTFSAPVRSTWPNECFVDTVDSPVYVCVKKVLETPILYMFIP